MSLHDSKSNNNVDPLSRYRIQIKLKQKREREREGVLLAWRGKEKRTNKSARRQK
jgi:hypothetical protein